MSQIQNSCISKQALLPPVFFMGAALLAGKYAIQYFPGASKNGLLVAAGLASTTSYLYDCALYDPDHSYLRTLLGKATAIAFATLCINLAAKSLEGRANISWEAAAKFAAVELAIAAVISYATGESALQKEHRHYAEYPYSWLKLSEEDSTAKALEFMKAGLPAFVICDGIDKKDFPNPKTRKEWEALTPSELSWTFFIREPKEVDLVFHLYELAQKKGIELLPISMIFEKKINEIRGQQDKINLVYQDMVRYPQFFYCHDDEKQQKLLELFQGKAPIPQVDVKLSPSQIKAMGLLQVHYWAQVMEKNKKWEEVPLETRSAYVKRFWSLELPDTIPLKGIDIGWLVDLTVEEIRKIDKNQPLKICNQVMVANREAVTRQLSPEQLEAFNGYFRDKGLREIE